MRTLSIDNYDSFTFNVFHLLGEVNGDEQLPRPDTRARQGPARHGPRPAERPTARLYHRALETWCHPEATFVALYGDREHAVWLDISRAGQAHRRSRPRARGAP